MSESLTGGREKLSLKKEMEFSGHRDGHVKKHRGQDQSDMEKVCGDVGDVQRYCSQGRSRMGKGRAKGGGRCPLAPLLVRKKRYAPQSCPIRTHDGGQHAYSR